MTATKTMIAIVGDHEPTKEHHQATSDALLHAGAALDLAVQAEWIPTQSLLPEKGGTSQLQAYDGVFLAPGAIVSRDGALAAIRFAREQGWPFFAT